MLINPDNELEEADYLGAIRLMWVPASFDNDLEPRWEFGVPVVEGAVGELKQMSRGEYLDRLEGLLSQIIAEDPRGAKDAMEMSVEYLPEPYSIAQFYSQEHWATQLRWSDSLSSALNGFDFDKPGLIYEFEARDLANILEQL